MMGRTRNAILFDSKIEIDTEYSLPTLSTPDLVNCFTAMQISVTEQDLLHPTPEGTQEIFRTILGLVKSWRVKNAKTVYGDNPTIVDTNYIWFLYFEVKKLLSALGHKDFQIADLMFPTPHRLARILSALANFAMFREESWATFETPASEIEEPSGREEIELKKKSQLEEEIEQYRERDEQQKLLQQQLELDNTEYEQELRNISSEGDALKMDHDKLREARRQAKDAMQDVQYNLLTMSEEIRSFQIGKNYDTVQAAANISKIKETADELQAKNTAAQKQVQSVKEQLEYVYHIDQNLERCTQVPREIQRLRNECDWVKTSIADSEGNVEKVVQKSNELQENQKKLHQLEEALKIKVQQHEEQEEKIHESRHQSFLKRTEEFEEAQKETSDIDTNVLKHKAKIAELEQELRDIRQESDAEFKAIKTHLNELESSLIAYLDGVIDALK
ncbi:Nuf2 family-domain-containing protein [Phascolomyces articulosus]|uniref:Nuf2 family-domain-containing protein n=1 Tax=Phascolomyces articulosus TaxID=60185 RepID=A0AAD5KCH6_9FUNG|nr:Nuf2 family-domain-containing protein [Phascolomyces articulosus]